jgi:hypothetical protein
MAQNKQNAADRRARIAAQRAAEARAERRRRIAVRGGIAVAGLALAGGVAGIAIAANSSSPSAASAAGLPAHPRTTAEGRTTPPLWSTPADATSAVEAAGLPMLGAEGSVEHIHAHLDILVDGKSVMVPALIGIDEQHQRISPLHTHDTTGVIHIESPQRTDFTLGQFLTEWQLSASADHLGGLKAGSDQTLAAYVNGKKTSGDPAAIVLHAHDEIALVYGPTGQSVQIPSSYTWPSGE